MIKRRALNRGTAVYLGDNRVRFVWACGCTRIERMLSPGKRAWSPDTTRRMVDLWRQTGISLEQCKRHPDWYARDSQIERLNQEHPNGKA